MRRVVCVAVVCGALIGAIGCKSEPAAETEKGGETPPAETAQVAEGEAPSEAPTDPGADGEPEADPEAEADPAVDTTGEAIPIPQAPAVPDGEPSDLGRIAALAERSTPLLRLDRPEDLLVWVREVTGSHPLLDALLQELGPFQLVLDLPATGRDVTRPVFATVPETVVDTRNAKAWTISRATHISLPAADPVAHRDALRDKLATLGWTTEGAPPSHCIPAGCVTLRHATAPRALVLAPRAADVLLIETTHGRDTALAKVGKTLDRLVVESDAALPVRSVGLDFFLASESALGAWIELRDVEDLSLRIGFAQIDEAMNLVTADKKTGLLANGGAAALGALSLAHGRGEIADMTVDFDPTGGLVLVHSLTANGRAVHAALASEDLAFPVFEGAEKAVLSASWRGNFGAGTGAVDRAPDEVLAPAQAQRLLTSGGISTAFPVIGQPWFLLARVVADPKVLAGLDAAQLRGASFHLTAERPEIAIVLGDDAAADALGGQPSELPWHRLGKKGRDFVFGTGTDGWTPGKETATGPFTFTATLRPAQLPDGVLPKALAPLLKVLPEGDVRLRRGVAGPDGAALVDQVVIGEAAWPALPTLTAHAPLAAPTDEDPEKCAYGAVDAYAQVFDALAKAPQADRPKVIAALAARSGQFEVLAAPVACAQTSARYAARIALIDGLVARLGVLGAP